MLHERFHLFLYFKFETEWMGSLCYVAQSAHNAHKKKPREVDMKCEHCDGITSPTSIISGSYSYKHCRNVIDHRWHLLRSGPWICEAKDL